MPTPETAAASLSSTTTRCCGAPFYSARPGLGLRGGLEALAWKEHVAFWAWYSNNHEGFSSLTRSLVRQGRGALWLNLVTASGLNSLQAGRLSVFFDLNLPAFLPVCLPVLQTSTPFDIGSTNFATRPVLSSTFVRP